MVMIGIDVVGGVPSIKFIRVSFTMSEIYKNFFCGLQKDIRREISPRLCLVLKVNIWPFFTPLNLL